MERENTFTTLQIKTIRSLIAEKVFAKTNQQKIIRARIRNIGFHYSKFSPKKGYTVADFDNLIRDGKIIINDDIHQSSTTERKTRKLKLKENIFSTIQESKDLNSNLDSFKENRFDPKVDNKAIIEDSSGNYIICLRKTSELPTVSIKPVMTNFEGLEVIYTGVAGVSLRMRDFRQHFKGNNSGSSTLRKSLGVLFGYKQIPRDKSGKSNKTKFTITDEQKLSQWMHDNLIMFFISTSDFDRIEIELINHFNPPLNLKGNKNAVNSEFRKSLSILRSNRG